MSAGQALTPSYTADPDASRGCTGRDRSAGRLQSFVATVRLRATTVIRPGTPKGGRAFSVSWNHSLKRTVCVSPPGNQEGLMDSIIYLVGLVVVIMAILSFLGLR